MSRMMRSEDLVEWAKAMGFPGADSPAFKANAGRLITPQHKTMWRHFIKHVRPANEVSGTRKQLLAYKLGVENNSSVNSLNKFVSVADYEAFLKMSALKAKMKHCDMIAEKKREDVKKLSTKLEDKGMRHQSQKLEEKEKMEKLRLLKAKREELEKQVDSFKQMVTELDMVMQPKYTYQKQRASDPWELEVQKYCGSFEQGQEIVLMCEQLREAMKTDNNYCIQLKDSATESEESMFHKGVDEYQCRLGLKLLELDEKYKVKLEQLEAKKQNMMSTMTSSGDVSLIAGAGVLNKLFESGRLEAVGKAAEKVFMVQWLHNNRARFDNSLNASYVEQSEKVVELDHLISQVQDEISFLVSFPISNLRSSLVTIVSRMKTEATSACFKEDDTPSAVVDKILSDLPHLIELFRITPMNLKKVDAGTQLIEAYTRFRSKLSTIMTAKVFSSVNVSVKEKLLDLSSVINHAQGKVSREESKMGILLNDLTKALCEIDRNLQHIRIHLACWEKYLPTEVICNYPDYQDMLTILKNAQQE